MLRLESTKPTFDLPCVKSMRGNNWMLSNVYDNEHIEYMQDTYPMNIWYWSLFTTSVYQALTRYHYIERQIKLYIIRYYKNDHIQDMIIIDNTKVILSNEIFYYSFQMTRGCIKNIDRVMETTKLCIQNI